MSDETLDLLLIVLFILWVSLGLADGIYHIYSFLHTRFKLRSPQ